MPVARPTPEDITFGDLTEKNLGQLRKLNEWLYPVRYQEKFYKDVLVQGEWSQYGTAPRGLGACSLLELLARARTHFPRSCLVRPPTCHRDRSLLSRRARRRDLLPHRAFG
jgi:hypothetical protein